MLRLVVEQKPVPPRHVLPGTEPDLETICLHSLNKEPEKSATVQRRLWPKIWNGGSSVHRFLRRLLEAVLERG